MGGNGGGTVGARRLLPTRRRGRARGVTGLPALGGGSGAGGELRVPETWGGGMVGLAGAGRLAVEEGKGWLGVCTAWGKPPSLMPPQELLSAVPSAGTGSTRAAHHSGLCPHLSSARGPLPDPAPVTVISSSHIFFMGDFVFSEVILSVSILLPYFLSP